MDNQIAEVLEEAADSILINGWLMGGAGVRGGPQCASGHLQSAACTVTGVTQLNVKTMAFELFKGAYSALKDSLGVNSIPGWNDYLAKDEWEVRDAFLTAAKNVRNEATNG